MTCRNNHNISYIVGANVCQCFMIRAPTKDFFNPPGRIVHSMSEFLKSEVDNSIRHGRALWYAANFPGWVRFGRSINDMSHETFAGIVHVFT